MQKFTIQAFYVTVPANTNGVGPNTALIPILKAGTTVSSDSGVVFTLNEDVDFKRSNTQIKVAKVDVNGTATNYALKAYGEVVSGEKGQETIDVEGFERFLRLGMDAKNVSDIIEIVDSDGNEYFQVDYLSQNVLFKAIRNIRDDYERVPYLLREIQVPRRFVLERDVENNTYLQFGIGDSSCKDVIDNPQSVAIDLFGKKYTSQTPVVQY